MRHDSFARNSQKSVPVLICGPDPFPTIVICPNYILPESFHNRFAFNDFITGSRASYASGIS